MLLIASAGLAAPPIREGDYIRVAPDRFTFQTAFGERYIPFGAVYFNERHREIDAMDYWSHFNEQQVEGDFALAERLGCNALRLCFYGTVEEGPKGVVIGTKEDEKKWRFLFKTAREHNLRLYVEPRIRGEFVQDSAHLAHYVALFTKLGRLFKHEPALFCWELDSEAVTLVGYPGDKELWLEWLAQKYPSEEANAKAWGLEAKPGWRDGVWDKWTRALQHSGAFDPIRGANPSLWYLDSENKKDDQSLYDWQLFREWLYTHKLKQVAQALRGEDSNHLLSLDLVLWAFPLVRNPGAAGYGGPYGYSAINLTELAKFVDFFGAHTYPQYIPPNTTEWYENLTRDEAIFNRELRYLETFCRYVRAATGKPVVHSETGWHGGTGDWQNNTEADQARWALACLEATKDCAVGWINWPLRDIPTHEGLSATGGLVTAAIAVKQDVNGLNPLSNWLYAGELPASEANRVKAWGKVFAETARAYERDPDLGFVPGKRIVISAKEVFTADLKWLDWLFQRTISDRHFPCDIVLER